MVVVKSILHNCGVVLLGLTISHLCRSLDGVLGLNSITFLWTVAFGVLLTLAGFLLRCWATYHFYVHNMKVIWLNTQNTLIEEGPFAITRNPLYLGGNVFIFLGTGLIFGSSSMLILTFLHLPLIDLMIRREERQLERRFGDAWRQYSQRVPRWI